MKNINYLLLLIVISSTLKANITFNVNVSSVEVDGLCQIESADINDPTWIIALNDNRGTNTVFEHRIVDDNTPNISVNTDYTVPLSFNETYSGVCPPNYLTIYWKGFEADFAYNGQVEYDETFEWEMPIIAGTYDLTREGILSDDCGGGLTWRINLEVVVSGTATCVDEPCDASDVVIQTPCSNTPVYQTYHLASSTSSLASPCAAGDNDIFVRLVAPSTGSLVMHIDSWNSSAALTGNFYDGSDCNSLSIAAGEITDGGNNPIAMDCIDFSTGASNDVNLGPFTISGLTPNETYYLRIAEDTDSDDAQVDLAFVVACAISEASCEANAGVFGN